MKVYSNPSERHIQHCLQKKEVFQNKQLSHPLSQDRTIFALARIPFSLDFEVLFEGVGALTGHCEG